MAQTVGSRERPGRKDGMRVRGKRLRLRVRGDAFGRSNLAEVLRSDPIIITAGQLVDEG